MQSFLFFGKDFLFLKYEYRKFLQALSAKQQSYD